MQLFACGVIFMAVVKEKGKFYIKGKIYLETGVKEYHRVARGCKNKKEAQEFERLFRKQYQDIQISLEKKTVLEVAEEMFVEEEQNGAKESTIRTNRYNLTKIPKGDQNRKINLTNHEHLQKIIRDMESSGFSENYVSAVYYLLKKIFKFAIYKGYIQINPMDRVKMRVNSEKITRELNFWEPDQFDCFISFCKEKNVAKDLLTFYVFSFGMGTRKGETLSLQWKDIDLINRTVSVCKTVTKSGGQQSWKLTSPKSKNSTRNLTMPEFVYDYVSELYDEEKKMHGFASDAFLFGFYRPWPLDKPRRHLQKLIKEYNQDAINPLPMLRIHDFRHSHASYLINNMRDQYSVYDVAKRLGDTVDTVLDTYAHWFKDADRKVVNAIDQQVNTSDASGSSSSYLDELKQLKELLDLGILTDDEFTAKKKLILGI